MAMRRYNVPIHQSVSTRYASDLNDREFALIAPHLPSAIAAYQAARAINSEIGIIGRVLRLHDALALADADAILAGVRGRRRGAACSHVKLAK